MDRMADKGLLGTPTEARCFCCFSCHPLRSSGARQRQSQASSVFTSLRLVRITSGHWQIPGSTGVPVTAWILNRGDSQFLGFSIMMAGHSVWGRPRVGLTPIPPRLLSRRDFVVEHCGRTTDEGSEAPPRMNQHHRS